MSISENISIGNKIKILLQVFVTAIAAILLSFLFHYIIGIKPSLTTFSISFVAMMVLMFFVTMVLLSKYEEESKNENNRVEVEELVSKIDDKNLIKLKNFSFPSSYQKETAINELNVFVSQNKNIEIINIEQIYPLENTYSGTISLWYKIS